ncbi:Ger(x)C family spore germination protein [Bacillaceae bacterium]
MRFLLLGLFLPVLFLAGCWDKREINDLALVLAAGIDKKKDKTIELSVQLAVPQAMGGGQQGMGSGVGGGGEGRTVIVGTADGVTVFDAMSKLQEKIPRRIFWGHNRVIVIGEEMAREGIGPQLDFFVRYVQPRLRAYLFVSKGKAAEVLNILSPLENSSAELARELANFRFGLRVTVKDFLQMLNGDSGAAALPWLEVAPTGSGKDEKEPKTLRLNGTVIFKEDKMVGRVDDKVTRGLLWVRDEIELAAITIVQDTGRGLISLELLRSRTELVPEIKDGKWTMTVKVDTVNDIVEDGANLDVMDPRIVRDLEKEVGEDIENRIRQALNKVQKGMKADVFGFAEAFHRRYPGEWAKAKERWDEIFPEIEVNIIGKAMIKSPGLSTEPQGSKERGEK